jgi:hypothetical protein
MILTTAANSTTDQVETLVLRHARWPSLAFGELITARGVITTVG